MTKKTEETRRRSESAYIRQVARALSAHQRYCCGVGVGLWLFRLSLSKMCL